MNQYRTMRTIDEHADDCKRHQEDLRARFYERSAARIKTGEIRMRKGLPVFPKGWMPPAPEAYR